MKASHPLAIGLVVAGAFALAFVVLPILAMGLDTIHDDRGFTLAPWRQILADPVDRVQMLQTLRLGGLATMLAILLGASHALLTFRTDLPGARFLGPLGALPLVVPPILVAMAFANYTDGRGLFVCALILGVANAPFVAMLTARGLRSIDGRAYEAALLSRGRTKAEFWLLRSIAPEIAAGALFAFIFIVSEHGVPEFLTVKGKAWLTYSEGMFSRWTRRAAGGDAAEIGSPCVAAIPLIALIAVALAFALRLRGAATMEGDFRPLPMRRLRGLRWPSLSVPAIYLGLGVALPIIVMLSWTAGTTRHGVAPSLAIAVSSFRSAVRETSGDIEYTIGMAACAALLTLAIALPLAIAAAGRGPRMRMFRAIDHLAVIPVAVPAILLGIGMVKVFNRAAFGDFYDSKAMLGATYAARFLPFAVLTLSAQARRVPVEIGEAAQIATASPWRRMLRVHAPLFLPAAWSAACLLFTLCLRELDLAVVIPAGNGTIVRRLSNIVHFGGEEMGAALALLMLLAALIPPVFTVVLSGRSMRSLS